jgi:hypothetical protein
MFANEFEFPTPSKLFDSRQAAHDEMLAVFGEVLRELRADGVVIPSNKEFIKRAEDCWCVWSQYY